MVAAALHAVETAMPSSKAACDRLTTRRVSSFSAFSASVRRCAAVLCVRVVGDGVVVVVGVCGMLLL